MGPMALTWQRWSIRYAGDQVAMPQLGMPTAALSMEGEGVPLVFIPQATMDSWPWHYQSSALVARYRTMTIGVSGRGKLTCHRKNSRSGSRSHRATIRTVIRTKGSRFDPAVLLS
jgi:hypothetical protein